MPGHNTQCSLSLTKRFLVVLGRIARGLAETAGLALARIWLLAPGDICPTCPMRAECPDQTQCLHLVASARAFGELTRLRERVELERDYLREEVRAAARGDECEQRNTRSAVTAVTDPESRCEPEGLSRTPRFVTRGNNNRHQPPLLDTWAWRILSFFGRLAWFKSPPRTPTT